MWAEKRPRDFVWKKVLKRERESLKERAQQRPDRVFVKEGEG